MLHAFLCCQKIEEKFPKILIIEVDLSIMAFKHVKKGSKNRYHDNEQKYS
jgi:hypothetical protein